MRRILPPLLFAAMCIAGCARRSNSNCEWPLEIAGSRLSDDAEFAEELAIHYADLCCGTRSRHFAGMPEYGRERNRCMTKLFGVVASRHGVTGEQVRRSLGQRRVAPDLAIILSFTALYAWLASLITRRINRRYADDDTPWSWMVMTLYASFGVSAIGVLLGEVWSIAMEGIRLGDEHLSYRTSRIPWMHHGLALFAGGVALYCLVAAWRRYGQPALNTRAKI